MTNERRRDRKRRTSSSGRAGTLALLATALLALSVGACSNRHEDEFGRVDDDPGIGTAPPRASGLRAQVANRSVSLFWDDLSGSDVTGYRLYRKRGTELEVRIASAIVDTTYEDRGLTNGVTYRYRVAATIASGLQGEPSDPIFVVPSTYSVLIADGDTYANEEVLSLTLNAPSGTASMRFAESAASIENAGWRAFSSFGSFEVSPGDGVRTVYAQFLDQGGNESRVVSDDVILDTSAEVLSVTHDAGASPVAPGGTVRFTVTTGEASGEAFIDIDGSAQEIELFDDGAHGDGGADDGTYALDWVVPSEAEVRDAIVYGTFVDAAGNFAEGTAIQTLTLNGPPTPVTLDPATNVMAGSVELSWSQNLNADFAAYRILRARTNDVPNDPNRVVVGTIEDRATTSFTDESVDEGVQVFFVIQVVDEFGATAVSNTISVTTPNAPPPSVTLSEDASTSVSVSMSWTESEAADFALYRVLRAVESSPGAFAEVAQFDQPGRVYYTDFFTAPSSSIFYYYKVVVEDEGGESSESNVISVEIQP